MVTTATGGMDPDEILSADEYAKRAQRIAKEEEEAAEQSALAIPSISDAQLARAEQSVKNLVKATQVSLMATNGNDWMDQGGKPYLQQSGIYKVARIWGVSFTHNTLQRVIEEVAGEQVIRFVASTRASLDGRTVEMDGIASSDDDFFTRKGSIPPSEVDINSVRKKAITNAQSRALKRLLGLDGLTWDEVNTAIKGRGGTVGKVDYAASKERREDRTGSAGASPGTVLWNLLIDLAEWERTTPELLLESYSAFQGDQGKTVVMRGGKQGIAKAGPKWVASTLKRVEEAHAAHPASRGEWASEPGEGG